jgi:hypothetical protein
VSACNPQEAADQIMRKTARAVIVPVLSQEMPTPVAQRAANCIIDYAEPAELRAVAADIGNSAGSQTIENIRNLALRPQSVACFIQNSVPLVKG